MHIRRRTIMIVFSVVSVVFSVAGIAGLVLLSPDRYRSQVISYLEAKTGHQIEIGHLAVAWRSASIELYDFGVRNPEPFPSEYVFRARRVEAHIKVAPLFRRRIVVRSVVLQDPIINVISDPDGLWNFENPHARNSAVSSLTAAMGTINS